ncbi:MAG: hypothetical protein NC254_14285 [bacterium]|nr:hypothetical protein [bacterium]
MKVGEKRDGVISVSFAIGQDEQAQGAADKKNGAQGKTKSVQMGAPMRQNPIQEKKEAALRKARKIVSDVFDKDNKVALDLEKRRANMKTLKAESKAAQTELNKINDQKAAWKEEYGVADDSQEQKDLELLEKRQDSQQPGSGIILSPEEQKRLAEIDGKGLTEYQKRSLEINQDAGMYRSIIQNNKTQMAAENSAIRDTKINMLAVPYEQGMGFAQDTAEDIKLAASKEAAYGMIGEVKDKIDDEWKEAQEKAEERKEEKEEQEEKLEAREEQEQAQEERIQTQREAQAERGQILERSRERAAGRQQEAEALSGRSAEAGGEAGSLEGRTAQAREQAESLGERTAQARGQAESLRERTAQAREQAESIRERTAQARGQAENIGERIAQARGQAENIGERTAQAREQAESIGEHTTGKQKEMKGAEKPADTEKTQVLQAGSPEASVGKAENTGTERSAEERAENRREDSAEKTGDENERQSYTITELSREQDTVQEDVRRALDQIGLIDEDIKGMAVDKHI